MIVTVCGADEAVISILPKERPTGEASISATPRPESAVVNVPFAELVDTTVSAPVRAPSAVGVKTMFAVQLAFAAITPEHVVPAMLKSPVMLTFEIVSPIALVFVQVTVCAAEVLATTVIG